MYYYPQNNNPTPRFNLVFILIRLRITSSILEEERSFNNLLKILEDKDMLTPKIVKRSTVSKKSVTNLSFQCKMTFMYFSIGSCYNKPIIVCNTRNTIFCTVPSSIII